MGQINLIVGQANQLVFYLKAVTGAGMDKKLHRTFLARLMDSWTYKVIPGRPGQVLSSIRYQAEGIW
jgi:hypothetical protein